MSTMHILQSILTEAGYNVTSYSGRGMRGETCVGVVGNVGRIVADVLLYIPERGELRALAKAFRAMQTDSMGTGEIVYFPSVPFTPAT